MLFSEYKATYNDFMESLHQVKAANRIIASLLQDYPKHLPIELQIAFDNALKALEVVWQGEHIELKGYIEDVTTGPLVQLGLVRIATGKRARPDFDRIIHAQELVMTLTLLEAFMTDTTRAVCEVRYAGDRDRIESYLQSHSRPNVAKRIGAFAKDFDVNFDITQERLDFLDEAENRRHVFVHNNGKVSAKYLEREKSPLALGESMPIDISYVSRVNGASIAVTVEVFRKASRKFFGVDVEKEHDVVIVEVND